MAKTSRKSFQLMLRLPEGLRERIKASADRIGRSMNAEIVDILEQEYPEAEVDDTNINRLIFALSLVHDASPTSKNEEIKDALYAVLGDAVASDQPMGKSAASRILSYMRRDKIIDEKEFIELSESRGIFDHEQILKEEKRS